MKLQGDAHKTKKGLSLRMVNDNWSPAVGRKGDGQATGRWLTSQARQSPHHLRLRTLPPSPPCLENAGAGMKNNYLKYI